MKPRVRPNVASLILSVSILGSALVSAQLTWDANGTTLPDPSDGSGAWLGADFWWDGAAHTTWNNTTHANTKATFGVGGTSGTVTLGTGVSAGGLIFESVTTSTGYLISGGTLTLAPDAIIDIRDGSSNSGAGGRVRLSSILAGSNITISNAVVGTTAGYATLSGSNTWTGALTLTGNSTGLFVDTSSGNALNTLTAVNIGSKATLALNTGTYTVPTLRIGGDGLGGRGSLRFDNGTVNVNSNVILTSDGRISTNGSGTGVINGVISGSFNLAINSATDTVNRIVLKNTNTFNQLTVNRGNVQIGVAGVGTSGAGVVNLAGNVPANPAVISGTGRTLSGLFVSGGMISPGDNFGANIGTLTIGANLNFSGLTTAQTAANFTLGAAGASDRINVTNNLTLDGDGNFSVLFDSSYTPTVGDSWTLLAWGGTLTQENFSIGDNLRTGADADGNEGNLNLADLSSQGYRWDIGLQNGALTVAIVPEPSHAFLGALGLFGFLGRRHRRS